MQKNSVAIPRESLPAPLRHISPLKHCGRPVMSFVKGGEHASSVQQAERCIHRNGNDKEVKRVLKNILRKDESDVCEPLQSLLLWYPVACRVAAGWVCTILRATQCTEGCSIVHPISWSWLPADMWLLSLQRWIQRELYFLGKYMHKSKHVRK